MLRDLRSDPDAVPPDADVCIIGAGPAGLALALELIGSAARVVVLESGGLEPDAATSALNRGENVGLRFEGLEEGRTRALGGTTKLWDGQCLEIENLAFEARDWVPHSGWPITKNQLAPYYARARRLLRIPDDRTADGMWCRGVERPALDPRKLACGPSVVNHRLDLGALCRVALERAENVHVVLHAHALELHADAAARRIQAVDVRTLEGRAARIAARAVVLCGGGIENARLLLLSDRVEPGGLGNRHGLVGRFFQEHPTADAGTFETDTKPRQMDALLRHFSTWRENGLHLLPRIHLSEEAQRRERVLGCVADVTYEHDARSPIVAARQLAVAIRERRCPRHPVRVAGRAIRRLDRVVVAILRRLALGVLTSPGPQAARLQIHLEQAPNPESRVSLSREHDPFGRRRARVDWRLSAADLRTADVMSRTVNEEFRRLGLPALGVADWARPGMDDSASGFREAFHHMGTTRMADNPLEGVVDANCQVHGVAGLYVAGSSVFPASGCANPTLTIVALAARLADHLKVVYHR